MKKKKIRHSIFYKKKKKKKKTKNDNKKHMITYDLFHATGSFDFCIWPKYTSQQ